MNKQIIKNLSNKNGKKYLIKADSGNNYYVFKLDKTKLNAFINEYIARYDITILKSY